MERSIEQTPRRSAAAWLIYAIQLCVCIVIGIPLVVVMTTLAVASIFAGYVLEHMKRVPKGTLDGARRPL